MRTTIPRPLRGDFRGTEAECRAEIQARTDRLRELTDGKTADDITATELAEIKRLNDEVEEVQGILERGEYSMGILGGIPTQPGRSSLLRRTAEEALKYGRLEGLGDAFLNSPGIYAVLDGTSGGATLPDPSTSGRPSSRTTRRRSPPAV